jgi:hypothetical protein
VNKKLIVGAIALVLVVVFLAWQFPSKPVADPIASAKQLLVESHIPVPPYPVELVDFRPASVPAEVAMWVYVHTQVIWVLTTTTTYTSAKAGDRGSLMLLAAMLVHEGVHAAGNPNEGPAYDAEIDALKKMGADQTLIQLVAHTKETALSQ